jgi:hypothetical protein
MQLLPDAPEQAIWSFAHSHELPLELSDLIKFMQTDEGLQKYYYRGRKNIIIFSSKFIIDRLMLTGVPVITEGKLYVSKRFQGLPIVVVAKDLPNQAVRELIGFHAGTLSRGRGNRYWVNFPLFITGEGSWMEAISAGGIWRHDNNDSGSSVMGDISSLIADGNMPASTFISDSENTFYRDLDYWTGWFKKFSDSLSIDRNRLVDMLGTGVYNALNSGRPQAPDQGGVQDKAMKGGIDLTPANNVLQTQDAGQSIKFHMDAAKLEQLQNAPGFVPVIINIQPLKSLSAFLGLNATNDNFTRPANKMIPIQGIRFN